MNWWKSVRNCFSAAVFSAVARTRVCIDSSTVISLLSCRRLRKAFSSARFVDIERVLPLMASIFMWYVLGYTRVPFRKKRKMILVINCIYYRLDVILKTGKHSEIWQKT